MWQNGLPGNSLHLPDKVLVPITPERIGVAENASLLVDEMLANVGLGPQVKGKYLPRCLRDFESPEVVEALQRLKILIHAITTHVCIEDVC